MNRTIRESLMAASSFLSSAGVAEQECMQHAEWLLMHVCGWNRTQLLVNWQEQMDEAKQEIYDRLIRRRAAGEPVQYLLGSQWFAGRVFHVTPDVLIPRPETELLTEAALHHAQRLGLKPDALIADIGTGSGIIAVTMAAERPQARVIAVDLSSGAIRISKQNANAHGVDARMQWIQGSFLEPWLPGGTMQHCPDILLSNPPYIPSRDMHELQREVRDHEPHLALDGGADGLVPYRTIVQQMKQLGIFPHIVGFEVGIGQAEVVAGLLRELNGWQQVEIINDWNGIGRVVIAYGKSFEI